MNFVVYFLDVLFAYSIHGVTGFGGNVLAMPVAALVLGVDLARTSLNVVNMLSGLVMAIAYHKDIAWNEVARMVGFTMPGIVCGILVYRVFPADWLLVVYGIVVAAIGAWYLAGGRKGKGALSKPAAAFVIFAAGLMQGMFVSGGPLLAIYAVTVLDDKDRQRASLSVIWFVVNAIVLAETLVTGSMPAQAGIAMVAGCVPMLIGFLVGGWLSKRLDQQTFLKITYVLLIITGVSLVANSLM